MKNNFDKIGKTIITKRDLIYFLDDINKAQELIFNTSEKPLPEKLKGKVNEELIKLLEEKHLNSNEQQNEFLNDLSDYIKELPRVKLTLAFHPSENFLKELSNWLKDQTGKQIIIDLIVNEKIAGGAIIEYQGNYLNFSLAKEIKQYVSNKKHEQV